jgi:hypothetical protein
VGLHPAVLGIVREELEGATERIPGLDPTRPAHPGSTRLFEPGMTSDVTAVRYSIEAICAGSGLGLKCRKSRAEPRLGPHDAAIPARRRGAAFTAAASRRTPQRLRRHLIS